MNHVLHWITAFGMFAILPLAWVMTNAKGGSELQQSAYNWHKTLGLMGLPVTPFRIVWRWIDRPLPYPPKVAAWDRAGPPGKWLLLASIIWEPVTGFIDSAYEAYSIKLSSYLDSTDPPKNKRMEDRHSYTPMTNFRSTA